MNITQLKNALRYLFQTNPKQAAMIWGLPGVGKSEAIRQLAEESGKKVVETRLSQMDPVDIKGIPVNGDGKTQWLTPSEFPTEDDGPTIWFLDEINAGARATMASAMQLVLDRRSGEYTVPDNVIMVAAGNETTHGAVANAMPSALSNRFIHFQVEPDLDSFIEWGLEAGMDYRILNFLRYRPELLHKLEKGKDIKGFPSPRTWEFVSDMDLDSISSPELRMSLIAGAVGMGAMTEFEGFLEVFKNLPSLSDILTNPATAPVPSEPSAQYAVVSALVASVSEDSIDATITYLDRLPREFAVMGIKDIINSKRDLSQCRALTQWEIENHNLIFG